MLGRILRNAPTNFPELGGNGRKKEEENSPSPSDSFPRSFPLSILCLSSFNFSGSSVRQKVTMGFFFFSISWRITKKKKKTRPGTFWSLRCWSPMCVCFTQFCSPPLSKGSFFDFLFFSGETNENSWCASLTPPSPRRPPLVLLSSAHTTTSSTANYRRRSSWQWLCQSTRRGRRPESLAEQMIWTRRGKKREKKTTVHSEWRYHSWTVGRLLLEPNCWI